MTKPYLFLFMTLAAVSCNNAQPGSPTTPTTSNATSTAASTPNASASLFTATIDGQTYSSSFAEGDHNRAVNELNDDKVPYLYFYLSNIKSADDRKTTRSFRIVVEKKTGTTHLTKEVEIPNYDIELDYNEAPFSRYSPKDMKLEITTLNDTRITGTFSGEMYRNDNIANPGKPMITVSCKFDIPVSPDPAP